MATIPTDNDRPSDVAERIERAAQLPELRIYSHSMFFYWWPLWAIGYIMAVITWMDGAQYLVGEPAEELYFPKSKTVGVVYTVIFFLLIVFTNVSVRGLASVVVILTLMFLTVLFAWLQWWDYILRLLPYLSVQMNLQFYVFFSSLIFLVWLFATFVYDRLGYWSVRPGQLAHVTVIGGAERSYDTRGMVFQKHYEDLFRHWILGFGSGDIEIFTTGAKQEVLRIPNVLFVDRKVNAMQKFISVQPDQVMETAAR